MTALDDRQATVIPPGRSELDNVVIDRLGPVLLVRMVRAARLNALSVTFMQELTEVCRQIERDPTVSVVILAGLSRTFSVGFDLQDPSMTFGPETPLYRRRALAEVGPRLCRALGELEPVTVAAIDGPCLGGGLALALSCDFRLGSGVSTYGLPEVARGLSLGWRVIPRLIALVGLAKARQMILGGVVISAAEALAWSLIDRQVEDGQAVDAAIALANELCAMPTVPLRMCKQLINAVADQSMAGYSVLERDQFTLAWLSEDFQEASRAFFQKDAPRFTGN